MLKNLRIGTKLFMGFGILLALFGLIGFVGWTRMTAVEEQVSSLAVEYVPEVIVATDVERATLKARSDIESYALSREGRFLQSGQAYLAETRKHLEEAEAHGERYSDLVKLAENVPKALTALGEYETLLQRARDTTVGINNALEEAGNAAEAYMGICNDFLSNQTRQMAMEIDFNPTIAVLKDRLKRIILINDLIDSGSRTQANTFRAIAERDPERLGISLELLNETFSKLDKMESSTRNPKRIAQIQKVRDSGQAYAESISRFRDNMIELQNIVAGLGEKAETLVAAAGEVTSDGISETGRIANLAVAEIGATLNFTVIVIGIAVLIAMAVAFIITRMITGPLKTVVALSERAGSGDLTVTRDDFNYDGSDELGQMADAMAGMIAAQRESVTAVIEEARNTVESAQSLAALSEETNASVEEVKSAVEQVAAMSEANSAALEETNAGVQEVSTSATNSAQASTEGASTASTTMEVAGRAVSQVNTVIDDIEVVGTKSKDVETTISDLAGAVKAISGFVDTITGIADQTNLLALNAAIEAARAGDAGRGFAVVADEVRKLAEESARAAKEVGTLISTLQDGTRQALSVTNESGNIMEKTVREARDAQEELSTALSEIARINDVMQNIAAGAQEQAAAAEQMAAGVDQVSAATVQVVEAVGNIRANSDETARASEGVASHAQTLTEGAERMRKHLARFRVGEAAISIETAKPSA